MQLRLVTPSPKPAPYPPTPTYTYPPTSTYTYQPTNKNSPVCKQRLHLPLGIPNYNGFLCRNLQQVWHRRSNSRFILMEKSLYLLYRRLHSEGVLPCKTLDVSTCAVTNSWLWPNISMWLWRGISTCKSFGSYYMYIIVIFLPHLPDTFSTLLLSTKDTSRA